MWPCKKSGGKSSLCGRTEALCISYRIVSISKHLSVSYTQSTLCRCPPCLTRYPLAPPLPDQPVALPVPVGAHSQRCAVLGAFAALQRLPPLHGDPFCLPHRRAVEIVSPLAAEIAHDVAIASNKQTRWPLGAGTTASRRWRDRPSRPKIGVRAACGHSPLSLPLPP